MFGQFVVGYERGLAGKLPNPWEYLTDYGYRRGWRRGAENWLHHKFGIT